MTDLVTLEDYKTYKKINSTNQDTLISQLITQISDIVQKYCGRLFIVEGVITEYSNGGSNFIYLNESPITALISVNQSIDNQVTQTELVEDLDFYIDKTIGYIETANGTDFIKGFRSIELKYTIPNVIDEGLKLAILDWIHYYLSQEYKPRQGTATSSIDNLNRDAIPNHIKHILDLHRVHL